MKLQITQMVNRGKHDYENVLISTLDNTNLLLSIHQDQNYDFRKSVSISKIKTSLYFKSIQICQL
ncbi:hypothetical protein [Chryseobacterium indologenes]|uniref:hypothetical protein n=1 Tax=Chryseobacterium indologenes TaxID=253 RepID=UPI001024835B|nr:hypothetical protein [Chryseobacterium indologenes]VFA41372.1 Uncharacterised protein [Chryseobacterium indologenes]